MRRMHFHCKISTASNVSYSASGGGGAPATYGYGGTGSGGSSGSSSASSTSNVGPDSTQLATLAATTKAAVDQMKAAQEQNKKQYDNQVKANQDIWKNNTLTNAKDTTNEWYIQQQKLQSAYGAIRDANGLGAYTGGQDRLNYLTNLSDDISDQQLLNNQQKNQNQLNETLYNSNVEATNAYNQSLRDTMNSYGNLIGDFVTQWGNLQGSSTTSKSNTDYGSDYSNSTTNSTTTSNANKFVTGSNESGSLGGWDQIANVFGKNAKMTNGSTDLFGSYVTMPSLQVQGNYRQATDTNPAAQLRSAYANRLKNNRY